MSVKMTDERNSEVKIKYSLDDMQDLISDIVSKDHPKREELVKLITDVLWNSELGVASTIELALTRSKFPKIPKKFDFGYTPVSSIWMEDKYIEQLRDQNIIKENELMPCIIWKAKSITMSHCLQIAYPKCVNDDVFEIDHSSCRLENFVKAKDEFEIGNALIKAVEHRGLR